MFMMGAAGTPPAVCATVFRFTLLLLLAVITPTQSQSTNATTTDPSEVEAINSIFRRWSISNRSTINGWNISGEPCSGSALVPSNIDNHSYNPMISCDCSYNDSSTCHITALKVYALDVVGVLPDELWTLIYLTNLNLAQNYLTGPLPASIGNLTAMQYLSLGINALSGVLPPELGQLTDLRSLAFGSNTFSGPLPSELGNLINLEQLYIDSSGVSGVIPSSFANLTRLITVWASDNELTGRIPDFIGNWSQLNVLRFQGNSFEGPIPSSFSNLTALLDLKISDLSNRSSSLEFLTSLQSLTSLTLRNNNISGSIPSNIGEYQNLTQLDLSFNSLTGHIPAGLFNLSQLSFLFLGNNSLTGTLPAQKSVHLTNIDLSYNELSGQFPSWVNEPNLQLNLVANNFTLRSSNNSVLPSGLYCLQRNFPCNRNRPIYYNFGIQCGGPQITSSNRILYERDSETLGPATYYVAPTNRWAVSNVGLHTNRNTQPYAISNQRQFPALDSELFGMHAISAGSLRYYGLGLENGNYTVTLRFAEIEIDDPSTWQSLGRRVFDIYIQGARVRRDFDIRREAGGSSYRPVSREFTVQVSQNYLEIHLFWAGKGTCCIPVQGAYGPLISAISATPNFNPSVSNNPTSRKENRTGLIVGMVVPIAVVSFLSLLALYWLVQRRKGRDSFDDEDYFGMDARPNTFGYAELRDATNDFKPENMLGEGGFGPVYKGTLADGKAIAVKQLSVASHHGKSQFVAEIATISTVQHRNLVKLYGCCIEADKRLLVYEYLENRSLDQALFGKSSLYLNWPTRFEICLGIARGLAYLHEESLLRIVHRDVKASNILLDSDLNPKISDFGLAKLYDDKKTDMSTRVAGTIGYLAPEYAMRGHLTEKADVFGFGVVALEIVSGRPNSDSSLEDERIYLLEWAWNLHENNCDVELVDGSLSTFDENEVKRVIGVALSCTQSSPMLRPSMSRAVAMLLGDIELPATTSKPGYLTDWKHIDDAMPFGYAELRDATNDFKPENKLGEGGFGPVYKGTLVDGKAIAVKQLSVASHHGKSQFVAEIATISAVQHRNLVKLYGCCIVADKRLLVYEYLENRSLDQALFGKSSLYINWSTRFEICLGIARGLAYLHEESLLRIVHRDVKASNILLDSDLNPKISDFGLAKLYDDKKTHMSTRVAGTIGYLAPEYAMHGHLTEKADVFGFGVVALEIVSGRPNSDSSLEDERVYLLEWAWNLHENNCDVELVDGSLSTFDENEVKRVIGVALSCTQSTPMSRPSMSRVVAMLLGDMELPATTSKPGYLTDWKHTDDAMTFMSSDTSTSRCDATHYTSGASSSFGVYGNSSPETPSKPMLVHIHDFVGDGR